MPFLNNCKMLIITFLSSICLHFMLQLQSCSVQALAWKPQAKFQFNSISTISDNFMKNLENPIPQTLLTFQDCGRASDAITIESFEVDPDPPKPGHKVTVYASGTVHELIEEGAYADVTVKLGSFIKLIQKRFNICEELSRNNATLQCPIEPGHYDIVQEIDLPKEIPHAKYTVEARAYTQTEDDMACANIVIDFLKS